MKEFRWAREIRDPIYGYVYVTGFENKIIDTPEFQRLNRIFQMTTAHFVYPSGCYTRKSHSFGVAHLASEAFLRILYRQCHEMNRRICALFMKPIAIEQNSDPGLDRLDQDLGNTWWDSKSFPELLQCLRLSSLLHDIGHSPFPHLFEDVCEELKRDDHSVDFDHEKMGIKIIEEKLASKFKSPFSYEDIKTILAEDFQAPSFLHELIDGPYDCDKLDYLQRDSYHCGTLEYGSIDYERVISGFRVKGKLLISESAISALMNSFKAVQYMYTNVYYHKTSRIFDFMISDALMSIPEFIKDIISEVNEFLKYDSFNFIRSIKGKKSTGTSNNFRKANQIFRDVLNRKKHYLLIYSHPITLRLVTRKEQELETLKTEIAGIAGDLDTKVDFSVTIRPIGISLPGLLKWLTHDNIYDESDLQTKNLEDINKAFFRELTRYQILFNVYGNRTKMKSGRFDHEKERIHEHCVEEIERMETEEEL